MKTVLHTRPRATGWRGASFYSQIANSNLKSGPGPLSDKPHYGPTDNEDERSGCERGDDAGILGREGAQGAGNGGRSAAGATAGAGTWHPTEAA